MNRLENVKSILFVDEIKFSKKDNDADNSFYFIGVLAKLEQIAEIREKYQKVTVDLKKGFHATKAYKIKSLNSELMNRLTGLIIDYNLKCLVFKYDKDRFYDLTRKHLVNLNFEESGKFTNHEFQALFYFLQVLESDLQTKLNKVETPLRIYFDRLIYGKKKPEEFDFDSEKIETITFSAKSKIDLLALPDHFGYIFRKCRIKYNSESGLKSLAELKIQESNSELINNCISNFTSIFNSKLFVFLDVDTWLNKIEKKNTTA